MFETIFADVVITAYIALSVLAVIGGFMHDYTDQKRARLARIAVEK